MVKDAYKIASRNNRRHSVSAFHVRGHGLGAYYTLVKVPVGDE